MAGNKRRGLLDPLGPQEGEKVPPKIINKYERGLLEQAEEAESGHPSREAAPPAAPAEPAPEPVEPRRRRRGRLEGASIY